jgi:hypothetical protein
MLGLVDCELSPSHDPTECAPGRRTRQGAHRSVSRRGLALGRQYPHDAVVHSGATAGIAPLPDLLPDPPRTVTALGNSLLNTAPVGIQRRWTSRPGCALWKSATGDELAHRSMVNRQFARDAFHGAALRVQCHHLLVQRQACGAPVITQALPSTKSRAWRQPLTPQSHTANGDLPSGLAQFGPSRCSILSTLSRRLHSRCQRSETWVAAGSAMSAASE